MKTIVTLTLNPAIDASALAEAVRPVHKVRTTGERFDAGGGGINVARVLRELGGETYAIYLAGGATGGVLDELLDAAAVPHRRLTISGHTRISYTVNDRSSGLEYRFVASGPRIEDAECHAVLAAIEDLDCDYLVASGSLPRGVSADFYATVAGIARRKGFRFVLDSSGDALAGGLRGGVHLVKPSLSELEFLAGRRLPDAASQQEAALALVREGAAQIVALTLGRDGAVLVTDGMVLRMPAIDVVTKSAVGAGDSFLAAMTFGLAQGRSAEDAFILGTAAGAATATTPGTELCRREDVERFYEQVRASAPAAG